MGTEQKLERIDKKVYVIACKRGVDGEEFIDGVCESPEGAIQVVSMTNGFDQIGASAFYDYSWMKTFSSGTALFAKIVPCTLRQIEPTRFRESDADAE